MNKYIRIATLIEKVSGRPLPVGPDESLFEAGVLDSFALADLVSALEKEFALEIPDADLRPPHFESVARIGKYIEAHLN